MKIWWGQQKRFTMGLFSTLKTKWVINIKPSRSSCISDVLPRKDKPGAALHLESVRRCPKRLHGLFWQHPDQKEGHFCWACQRPPTPTPGTEATETWKEASSSLIFHPETTFLRTIVTKLVALDWIVRSVVKYYFPKHMVGQFTCAVWFATLLSVCLEWCQSG